MSEDKKEAPASLTENADTPSDTNEEDLDLFEDDPSEEEGADKPNDWEARAKKAEKYIVEMKRNGKKAPRPEDINTIVDKRIAEREFYREHPDAKDYEKEINDYVSKGISIDKAYRLIKLDHEGEDRKDKQTKSNRATLPNTPAPTKSRYTLDELDKLPLNEYAEIKKKIEKGEVTVS